VIFLDVLAQDDVDADSGAAPRPSPYVAETTAVSVESDYVVVDL